MFFHRQPVDSSKNGQITLRKFFGKTELLVDGFDQSTKYTEIMWRQAVRKVPKGNIKTVLMLGLGGGSAIKNLQRHFHDCQITVVEWDAKMIALYKEIHPNNSPITIIYGDAMTVVPALTTNYDLVMIDLFKGNKTPDGLADDEMISAIKNVIAPNGYCLLNAFVSLNLPPLFSKHLTEVEHWQYKYNQLFLYRLPQD